MDGVKNDFLRVAAAQLNSTGDLQANLEKVFKYIIQAKEAGAQFISFPENSLIFYDPDHPKNVSFGSDDNPIREIVALATKLEIAVHIGSFPERIPDTEKVYNTSAIIHPDGRLGALYRKIHLFNFLLSESQQICESDRVQGGRVPVIDALGPWNYGLSICYDLRFPELYRVLSQKKAHILLIPSAFTSVTGPSHWEVLLRARSIENQCYVIAAAQWGKHNASRESFGHRSEERRVGKECRSRW